MMMTRTTIIIMGRGMTTAMDDADLSEAGFLRLLTWLSPAFPTGGFAYSHGIEWAVETGDARSTAGIVAWIVDILEEGSGRNDAILLRHAHRAVRRDDRAMLAELVELAAAIPGCRERFLEATAQGNAFLAAAAAWPCPLLETLADQDVAYPVAVGAVAAAHGIGEERATLGFLHTFAANLVSAAIRIIPLGQQKGLRILSALEPVLVGVADASRHLSMDDIGSSAIRADLAAMHHETQYTRLFRS
jgi:urease accessory protein